MNIRDKKEFFQKIYLDANGNMFLIVEPETAPTDKGGNQYKTFKQLQLTPEGYLKVYNA